MARLHPTLELALPLLPEDRPVHLLTRHSVRELAPNGFADYRLPLTPEGIRMAREWGSRLPRPVARLHSSPVGRCVDTASALQEGGQETGLVSQPLSVHHEMQLVEPGCFVQDIRRVGPRFLRLGALEFISRLLDGQPMDGLLSADEGAARLTRYLWERQPPSGHLAVHVTHDTILAAFLGGLLGWNHVDEQRWPWMMEGAWMWFQDDALHWIWRGEPGHRPVAHWLQP